MQWFVYIYYLCSANESQLALLPFSDINLRTGERANLGEFSSLAECILSPEFHALSHFSRDAKYRLAADGAVRLLQKKNQEEALWYIMRDPETSLPLLSPNNVVSMGSRGDSFYEYVLKTSIMCGVKMYEDLFQSFKDTMPLMMVHADKVSNPLLQPTIFPLEFGMVDTKSSEMMKNWKMDHLACFLPGVFALDHMFPDGARSTNSFARRTHDESSASSSSPSTTMVGDISSNDAAASTKKVMMSRGKDVVDDGEQSAAADEGDLSLDDDLTTDGPTTTDDISSSRNAATANKDTEKKNVDPTTVEDGVSFDDDGMDAGPIPFLISWQGGQISLKAVPALWNRRSTTVFAQLQYGHDACTVGSIPPTSGTRFALLADRGNCPFQQKARLAKLMGYEVVLVADYKDELEPLHTLLPDGQSDDHSDSAQLFLTSHLQFKGEFSMFTMTLPYDQKMEPAPEKITANSVELGKELLRSCVGMSFRTKSGLAPEITRFSPMGLHDDKGAMFNALRPETVESLFYYWRLEKRQVYRNWGWRLMEAWQKHSRTKYGFAHVLNVNQVPVKRKNSMESFFLAETLKYLYLLFADDTVLPLDKFVLNTEAHPLPSDTRTDSMKFLQRQAENAHL